MSLRGSFLMKYQETVPCYCKSNCFVNNCSSVFISYSIEARTTMIINLESPSSSCLLQLSHNFTLLHSFQELEKCVQLSWQNCSCPVSFIDLLETGRKSREVESQNHHLTRFCTAYWNVLRFQDCNFSASLYCIHQKVGLWTLFWVVGAAAEVPRWSVQQQVSALLWWVCRCTSILVDILCYAWRNKVEPAI